MFRQADGRTHFYQWDVNQRLICAVESGCAVQFVNGGCADALSVLAYEENGRVYADVPNILLQSAEKIFVYAYVRNGDERHTDWCSVFDVKARVRPPEYVYTETEIRQWDTIADEARETVRAFLADVQARINSGELRGDRGEQGERGLQGEQGIQGERGEQGETGATGADGYTPIKGIDYFDGANGKDGKDGKDGADGRTPVKGVDYWTQEDIAAIVQSAVAALPDASEVLY